MKVRGMLKNVVPKWFCRTYCGVPNVAWLVLVAVYYWWLILKISQDVHRMNNSTLSKLYYEKDNTVYDPSRRLCETIHIAIVCSSMKNVTPMLKSLMYHRQNPLHFHLIVDTDSSKKVEVFFITWDLPDVQWTFYNTDKASILADNALLPANRSAFDTPDHRVTTMLIPLILPVNQSIVLHNDLTILCDIFELWQEFGRMSKTQFVGMVKDQRALNRVEVTSGPAMMNYNTGVMLLDLAKFQKKKWISMWQDTFEAVKKNPRTPVDQCNFNGVIGTDIVYDISCRYNVQMAAILNARRCYGYYARNVKIINWNAKVKESEGYQRLLDRLRRSRLSPDVDYFMGVRSLYVDIQGEKLRHKLHRCSYARYDLEEIDESDDCTIIHAMRSVKLLTHVYYLNYKYSYKTHDVTLVVQLSMDRMQQLERLAEQWDGPISAAVYVTEYEVRDLEDFINYSDILSERHDIAYHLVFKSEFVHYPINYLRNVALENSQTPYVFLVDVDFVLSSGLYDRLRSAVKELEGFPKKCLIVPAFQNSSNDSPPRSKVDLLPQLTKNITPFKSQTLKDASQKSINYSLWINATEPYTVKWLYNYESHMVVHRSAPLFDTRFSVFGWDKISHGMELRVLGYSLQVLPDVFLVHTPHAMTADPRKYNLTYQKCIIRLKNEFMKDLIEKYNITHLIEF